MNDFDTIRVATAYEIGGERTDRFPYAVDAPIAPIDSGFTSLLARPQFAAAVSHAQELAKNSGLDDIFFRGANGAPNALLGQGGQPFGATPGADHPVASAHQQAADGLTKAGRGARYHCNHVNLHCYLSS
jgi:hypothetical protein